MFFNNICDAARIGRYKMVFNNITCILLKSIGHFEFSDAFE